MKTARLLKGVLTRATSMNRKSVRNSRWYGTEAAEIANAVKEGKFSDVSPDIMERCPVCSKMYHEMLEGRAVYEVPPACAVQEAWIKDWMKAHDSFDVYPETSLDGSAEFNDQLMQQIAEKTVVLPKSPEEGRMWKCGLYCCEDKPSK